MVTDLITGIVYSECSDDSSALTKMFCVPYDLSEEIKKQIKKKMDSLLIDKQSFIPESLIVDFPSLNLKALVKFLRWEDDSCPDGWARTFITLVFKEVDDLIFYKYKEDIDEIFKKIEQEIVNVSKVSKESISLKLKEFNEKIVDLLEKLRAKELSIEKPSPMPKPEEEGEVYVKKVIVLGDAAVGKTSLILKFTDKAFKREYIPTLGVNISEKMIIKQNNIIRLMLWDLGGQQRFEAIRRNAYAGAEGVIYVFDLTNPKTLLDLTNWQKELKKNLKKEKKSVSLLVGNKSDMIKERKVTQEEIDEFSKKNQLKYYETSALNGTNVEKAFKELADQLVKTNA